FAMTQPADKSALHSSKPKSRAARSKNELVFTAEDEKASFKPIVSPVKDAFMPLVARKGGIGSGQALANMLPSEMTGGETNWVYTGSAEMDGVPSALIENRTTGDAVFLKKGERWKSAYVVQILPDSVVMRGPGGLKTLGL